MMIALVVSSSQLQLQDDPVDNWNYEKGGEDWDFKSCNDDKKQQSPIDIVKRIDWNPIAF